MNVELTNKLSISERIKHHKKKINKHENAILKIQQECHHEPPYLSVEYESDSGNWCNKMTFHLLDLSVHRVKRLGLQMAISYLNRITVKIK